MRLWGHPHRSSPYTVQFCHIQHSNALSLSVTPTSAPSSKPSAASHHGQAKPSQTWLGLRSFTWLCRRELMSNLRTGLPNHQPIQPLRYSQCLGQLYNQEPLIPGVFDFVLSGPGPPPSRWAEARDGITSSEGGVSSKPPPLHPLIIIPLHNRSRGRLSSI